MLNRNKVLGEESSEEEDDDDVTEKNFKKAFTPQYVNIRRQRPSTTEGLSTSKYVEVRRSTTEANNENNEPDDPYSK